MSTPGNFHLSYKGSNGFSNEISLIGNSFLSIAREIVVLLGISMENALRRNAVVSNVAARRKIFIVAYFENNNAAPAAAVVADDDVIGRSGMSHNFLRQTFSSREFAKPKHAFKNYQAQFESCKCCRACSSLKLSFHFPV